MCQPLKVAWAEFEAGNASLLDLSRLAQQAAGTLDNANVPSPAALEAAIQ